MIRLRFVSGTDRFSRMIQFEAGTCMPFAPCHVEAVSQDGKSFIGQHIDGGMRARPAGYDAATLAAEKFVDLDCPAQVEKSFYDFVHARIGQSYDWKSILGFIDPGIDLHEFDHAICSAEMVLALRAAPAPYFQWPLTMPAHRISPALLFLILSTHVEIPH